MFTGKILPKMAQHGLTFGEHCIDLVPYSRKFFHSVQSLLERDKKQLIWRIL
jgi:hypothetical protein